MLIRTKPIRRAVFCCIALATVNMAFKLYIDKTAVSMLNITSSFLSSVIIGILFGGYIQLLSKENLKKYIPGYLFPYVPGTSLLKASIKAWVFICISTTVFWGIPSAAFFIALMKCIIDFPYINFSYIADVFIGFGVGGFCIGNILFVIVLVLNHIYMRKPG